jgi:hypothetical protein
MHLRSRRLAQQSRAKAERLRAEAVPEHEAARQQREIVEEMRRSAAPGRFAAWRRWLTALSPPTSTEFRP